MPRLNSNEDTCVLVEWVQPNGTEVADQALLAVVETSKAAAEIYSDGPGVFQSAVSAGRECRVGEVIGYLFDDGTQRHEHVQEARDAAAEVAQHPLTLTESARRLSELHGIAEERLRSLGKRIVRTSDVERMLAIPVPDGALPSAQQTIANVVSRAHREIPDAFLAMRVDCAGLLDRIRETNAQDGLMIGLPEVAIRALAGLKADFPAFFATCGSDGLLRLSEGGAHIGVTIDVGTGLFVPVVRDAERLTVREVADRLMDVRVKALHNAFSADDLADGQLSLSLAMDADVIIAIPIILPPQVCMVVLGAPRPELALASEGQVVQRTQLTVGLSYDHRVINGQAAAQFLTAFKAILEQPEMVIL